MQALQEQFKDPSRKRVRTKLKQQGKKMVHSTEFCAYAAKAHDCTEAVKVEFYNDGLNPNLVAKAMIHDDPCTLFGWIQLACKNKN